MGLMAAGRGVGAVVSGPISENLLQSQSGWDAGFAYGTSYGVLIVFSGVTAMFGGTACIGRILKVI